MPTDVVTTVAPEDVFECARSFLERDPVRHNVILTLLEARVAHPEPGRYWVARVDGNIRGVALQSPTHFFITLTPMPSDVVNAVVDAVVDLDPGVPGVNGEAATAARFAGHWTERTHSAARPVQGQRIYEVDEVVAAPRCPGRLRPATTTDRELLVAWSEAFEAEAEAPGGQPPADVVDRRLLARQLWVWEDGEPVSMSGLTDPVAGVVRVGPVYTPPERRHRGYASALVAAQSSAVRARGLRCILYTDLGNATSNGIYRAIGYRAVDEVLRYDFG